MSVYDRIKLALRENEESLQVPEAPPGKIVIGWYAEESNRRGFIFKSENWEERLDAAVGPLIDMEAAKQIHYYWQREKYGNYNSAPQTIIIKFEIYNHHIRRNVSFMRKVTVSKEGRTFVVDKAAFLKKYREVLGESQKNYDQRKSAIEQKKSDEERIDAHVEEMKRRYPDLHIEAGYHNDVTISEGQYGKRQITYYPLSDSESGMTVKLPQSMLLHVIKLIKPEQNETAQTE